MNAPALITHKARGVAVIVVHHGAIGIGQIADRIQLRDGAVHGKDPVGSNQDTPGTCVARLLELGLEVRHIVISITIAGSLAQADAINNRCMIELIRDNRILRPEDGFEQPRIGIETGGVQYGVFHTQKVADAAFEGFVYTLSAADEPNRRRAEPPLAQTVAGRLHHLRVIRKTEVVVRAHVDHVRTAREGDIIFLIGGNNPFGLPQTGRFNVGDLCGVALFCSLIAHINPSNPESLCPIDRSA